MLGNAIALVFLALFIGTIFYMGRPERDVRSSRRFAAALRALRAER